MTISTTELIRYQPYIQRLKTFQGPFVDALRLDLLHPEISGNKWFKLKKNLEAAIKSKANAIVTYGGANSNHLAACAVACSLSGIPCIALVRGEKTESLSETLRLAKSKGMQLFFVSREHYKNKNTADLLKQLQEEHGKIHVIPEGGANKEGVEGCMEILPERNAYNYVLCACGTGTTYAGLFCALQPEQKLIGINVLKGKNEIRYQVKQMLNEYFAVKADIRGNEELENASITHSMITDGYALNGYAKYSEVLVNFKRQFEKTEGFELDYLYTGKLFYAVNDMIVNNKFKADDRLLVIHSGGLQSNRAFEQRYSLKLNL